MRIQRGNKADAHADAEDFRKAMPVALIHQLCGGYRYAVCPRCGITLEREYQSYCDRCGQCLGWRSFRKARIVRL